MILKQNSLGNYILSI